MIKENLRKIFNNLYEDEREPRDRNEVRVCILHKENINKNNNSNT